ncbi:MAG: pyruvate, phosphate dikinase [Candidatus Aenigmatarchaeota archaeon]
MTEKNVWLFDEAAGKGKELLGGKGHLLADMTKLGLPVPPGFTITTDVCRFFTKEKKYPDTLDSQVDAALKKIEAKTGKKFGDGANPLLVSVRSGSPVSMPGMMDTILNLGLNDKTAEAISKKTGNERFAYDCYRRLLQMFGDVVMGVEHAKYEHILENHKKTNGVEYDKDISVKVLKTIIVDYKTLIRKETGKDFPQEPKEQLRMAIDAVFKSWNNKRAITYRRLNHLPDDIGTAVNVQSMVFGNTGDNSGTGVGFTRNPSTGKKEHYGEYLINAQGEDVVAGIRTPHTIDHLKKDIPKAYDELIKIYEKLENNYKDMQDFEFTIEDGKLYLLQTRNGKRTSQAAVKIAVEMVKEGLIDKKTAVMRVDPDQLNQLLHKQLDPIAKQKGEVLTKGLPASPGAAVGEIVLNAEKAKELAEEGKKLILVRTETSPEDIEGMHAAQGILTSRGGMTCVAGDSTILTDKGFLTAENAFELIKEGESLFILSYDSKSGKTKWRNIIAAGKRLSDVIEASVSQTGRATRNTIKITPDHKIITFENRRLIKKPISDVITNNEFVTIVDKIPFSDVQLHNEKLAYLAGAILTDGYINLKRTKGSVTFTQKQTEEKTDFIEAVRQNFNEVFNKDFNVMRTKVSNCYLNGRLVQGEALDMICTSMQPALALTHINQNIVSWVLGLDEESTLSFLAGVVDGDGCLSDGRLQVYVSKENLKQGIVAACLKLGIEPQVTFNRNINNIQIVERIDEILECTKRVKGPVNEKKYGSKLFSVKQLFEDITEDVNFMGRVKEAIKRNLLFDSEKIARDILPLCRPAEKAQISDLLNSDLRMYRVIKTADLGKSWVFNFEVDSDNELDKNFVVFTRMYTPLLVSNSHAAVVARGMGKCCVSGASDVVVDEYTGKVTIKGVELKEGDYMTLDGSTGEVYKGKLNVIDPELSGNFAELMEWADSFRKIKIKTNADTPHDAEVAKKFGAEGIGLCRTEHMFFEGDRITSVREMILAETLEDRKKALDKLLAMQKEDFKGIFKVMNGFPVIIRLLDPPLHEFLPKEKEDIDAVAKQMHVSPKRIKELADSMHEFNPMLGFRGCRLGIAYPEITAMQTQAILEAAMECKAAGIKVIPQIEVPLVGNVNEFKLIKDIIKATAKEIGAEGKIHYEIGTMIEVPRAAVTADKIAVEADFMSFGTNDLTQMGCGFSRDDSGKFLKRYVEAGIYERDPFQAIDREGVGELMKICMTKARSVKPKIEIGICGEHGGEPTSVEFCHMIGMNDVSCSPFRVPIARLAAAQAAIKHG